MHRGRQTGEEIRDSTDHPIVNLWIFFLPHVPPDLVQTTLGTGKAEGWGKGKGHVTNKCWDHNFSIPAKPCRPDYHKPYPRLGNGEEELRHLPRGLKKGVQCPPLHEVSHRRENADSEPSIFTDSHTVLSLMALVENTSETQTSTSPTGIRFNM